MTGIIQSAGALATQTPDKIKPSVRASNITTVGNAAIINVVIPATAVIGDLALVFISSKQLSYVTRPTGWTLEAQTRDGTGAEPRLTLFSKHLVAGDPGASISISISTADAAVASCVVVQDAGGFSCVPQLFVCETGDHVAPATYRCPSSWSGPDDLVIGAAASYPTLSLGNANAKLSAVPPGATLLQTDANFKNSLVISRGLGVWSAPGHRPQFESINWPNNCYFSSISMAFGPVDPHWSDVEHAPSSVESGVFYHYGTSSGGFIRHSTSDGAPSNNFNTNDPWPNRIADAAIASASNNMAMPGARAADICSAAYGNKVIPTRALPNDIFTLNQAVTATALTDRLTAIYTTDLIGNDVISMGTSAQALAGCSNATDALLRLLRSATVTNCTDSSCTYFGTWTALASDGLQGGTAKYTTVPGASISVAVSGVTAVDLVLAVEDNTALSTVGATFSVTIDGATYKSGITHNQMLSTAPASFTNYQRTQMVVPVEGLTTGAHTITLTHTGSSGDRLIFNAWMTRSATAPWITTNALPLMPAGTYTKYTFTQADADTYETLLRSIAAQFTDGRVVVYKASENQDWDTSAVFSYDGIHQNELGHSHYGHEILRALRERVPSPPAAAPAPPRPSEVTSYTAAGTYTFTPPVGATEMIVQCVGAGGGGAGGGSIAGTGGGGAKGGTFAQSKIPAAAGTVVVGAGGAGLAVNATGKAPNGGISSFGSTVVAAGGGGGGGTNRYTAGTTLNGTSVGDLITNGADGGAAGTGSGSSGGAGGAGGDPLGGAGGAGGAGGPTQPDNVGNPGTAPGGGGGGGKGSTSWGAGGNGADGAVNIIAFFD